MTPGRLAAATVLLAAAVSPARAQELTSLRYHWAKGETVRYHMTLQTDRTVSGVPNQADIHVTQTVTQDMRITVEDVTSDGTATLRQTINAIKMTADTPQGKLSYDTEAPTRGTNPVAEAMGKMCSAVIGESIVVTSSADGTIRNIDGASELLDKVRSVLGTDPAAVAAGQAARAIYSEEALRSTLSQTFPALPPAPVKLGESWSNPLSLGNPMVGRIGGSVTFTLRSFTGTGAQTAAIIGVEMTLKQAVAPPRGDNMSLTLGDNKGQGEMTFELVKGRIDRSTMHTDTPSTVTMTGPDGKPVSIHNHVTTTMTMELVAG